jgi:hypothetical protein
MSSRTFRVTSFSIARVIARQYRSRMVDELWRAAKLLSVMVWIAAPVILAGSTFGQTAQQTVAPVAAQSDCPETLPDVDRVACLVSAAPAPVPAGPKPQPPLLRGSDGTTIIGPNSSR